LQTNHIQFKSILQILIQKTNHQMGGFDLTDLLQN